MAENVSELPSLQILLIGKTGSGVSATGNTILGENVFLSQQSSNSKTHSCQEHRAEVSNRRVTVIDTPTFFNTEHINLNVELKIRLNMGSPGIHAILLVLPVHQPYHPDTVSSFRQMFGKNAMKHTLVVFTHGDELTNRSLDQLIEGNTELSKLKDECGKRVHLLNNKDLKNRDQVTELMTKIKEMVCENQNSCYTLQMFDRQPFKVLLQKIAKYPCCIIITSIILLILYVFCKDNEKCMCVSVWKVILAVSWFFWEIVWKHQSWGNRVKQIAVIGGGVAEIIVVYFFDKELFPILVRVILGCLLSLSSI